MDYSATDSLPLYTILEEEHQLLHLPGTPSQTAEKRRRVRLGEGTSSAEERIYPSPQEPVHLVWVEKLWARVAAQFLGPESSASVPPTGSKGQQKMAKTEYPYARLAAWIQADPDGQNLSYEAATDRFKKALLEKIGTDTKILLEAEPWLRDAALRPYTRGLLKSYFDQGQPTAPAKGEMPRAGAPTSWSGWGKGSWSAEKLRYLNRLLIEDAFAEYIRPDETTRLNIILGTLSKKGNAALCLSGGGIRSATFALGVLQGLARLGDQSKAGVPNEKNILWKFNYLSTVSGGGYLGSWLSAWTRQVGFGPVIEQLRGVRHPTDSPLEPETTPLRHLRQYSNYLSPRLGLLSMDTWTLVSTYLRNLLLVWLVIMPFLAAVAAIPWVALTLSEHDGQLAQNWFSTLCSGLMDFLRTVTQSTVSGKVAVFTLLIVVAMLLMTVGLYFVHSYLPQDESLDDEQKPIVAKSKRDQSAFLWRCLLPITFATLVWVLAWRWFNTWQVQLPWDWYNTWDEKRPFGWGWLPDIDHDRIIFLVGGAVVHSVAWLSAHVVGWWRRKKEDKKQPLSDHPRPFRKRAWRFVKIFSVILITGVAGGFLLHKVGMLLMEESWEPYVYTCLAFPSVFLVVLAAGYAFEGIASRLVEDSQREWMARYSAWVLVVAVAWLALTGLVLYGPILAAGIGERLAAAGVGLGSGILTALLGQSSKTAGEGEGAGSRQGAGSVTGLVGRLSGFALPLAAVLTILGLFVALSVLDMALIRWVGGLLDVYKPAGLSVRELCDSPFGVVVLVLLGLLGVGFLFAWLVNTNRFSLHALYRARLIRAYLGASRPPGERKPDPFTGFDDADNPQMGDLARPPLQPGTNTQRGPFHIVNLALNLVAGQNLAWQERMAESFTVSCLHAGATHLGYRRTSIKKQTDDHAGELYGGDRGISLGTAMTISGAAASPNMGYHSSPVIAFLMTLFNIRLGWWLGNPGPAGDDTFHLREPRLAVRPIFDELLANTDDTNPYVYLSDGGHFENLGLYEMVLRRNRFIVVSDAGCDETCTLEDLGNAIRKIRIDLGIPIDFSENFKIRARSSDPAAPAGRYWALGRIRYSCIDRTASSNGDSDADYDGLLLYIKPGIYGNEPRDVFNYASANPAFPHESTSDQFFSESQFESYRALGAHAVHRIGDELGMPLENLFDPDVRKAILESWTSLPLKPPGTEPGEVRG